MPAPGGSPHFFPAMPTSPTGTYLPIRVVAPVGSPCQSDSPGIRIPAGCTQDKMPRSAAPRAPGHGGQELEETTGQSRERRSTPVGPTAWASPPKSGTLFTSWYLAPGSKHLDETQVESMDHHPDIHDSQRPLSEPGLRNPSVLLTLPSGISSLACPSSGVQFDKWHLHPPSSSCQTHNSHPNTSSHHGPPRPTPPPTVS